MEAKNSQIEPAPTELDVLLKVWLTYDRGNQKEVGVLSDKEKVIFTDMISRESRVRGYDNAFQRCHDLYVNGGRS